MAATEPGGKRARLYVALGLALWSCIAAASVGAQERVVADGHLYVDSDGLEVWHPHAGGTVQASDEVSVSAAYDADVVSAATIDVRTSASPRGFTEARHGLGADVAWAPAPTIRIGSTVTGSFAPDYTSGTTALRLSVEDDLRVHTFGAAATASHASVSRVGDQHPTGEASAGGASLGWGTVLSRAVVLDLSAAGEIAAGYLESPYRFVSIYDPFDAAARLALPEALPDLRLRGALRARLRIAPTDAVFLRGSYRMHADDWGVFGHTVEAELSVVPTSGLTVTGTFRFLGQRAASFYQGRYETLPVVPELRARDRELAATSSIGGGLVVELRLPVDWEVQPTVLVRGELLHTRLYDTPLLPERLAGIVGVGLSLSR